MFDDLPRPTQSEARSRLDLRDVDTLLFLGLLRPYKGLLDLLEALPRVLSQRPQTQLVIAGQGEPGMLRELRTAVEQLGLAQHVVLQLRYVPLDQVPVYHAAADAVVLPYREATQSGALMGAAGLGTVPVCTTVGGLSELLSEDESRGFLAPPREPEQLAAALLRALSAGSEERARRARALAAHVAEHSSWDRAAQTTLRAYHAALESQR
jgi:glycosyltransferase involved in cell wall biosynthesis